jgi:hypothetical protein
VEVAKALQTLLRSGKSPQNIAAALYLNGTTMISRFTILLNMPHSVQHLVDWGATDVTLSFTAAYEIARLPDKDDQEILCTETIRSCLTSAEVRSAVQRKRRSKKAVLECAREIVALRDQKTERHLFIGAIADHDAQQLLAAIPQLERDRLLQDVLRDLLDSTGTVFGRLGDDRFALSVEDPQLVAKLSGLPDGFEASVSRAITKFVLSRAR